MADVAAGRMEGLGTPEVTEREVTERRGRGPVELELGKRGWTGKPPDEGSDAMDFVLAATGRRDPETVAGKPVDIYA
jgi:hypothetical protein